MADQPFEFDLYRLIVVESDDLFESYLKSAATDADYLGIVRHAARKAFDVQTGGKKNKFTWSLREFRTAEDPGLSAAVVACVRYARSLAEHTGPLVTEEGIEDGVSTLEPPPAIVISLVLYMERHLVAVEHNGSLMSSDTWRDMLHEILDAASKELGYRSRLRLEPVPAESEIMSVFRGFTRLTRLRARLFLPNPEFSRHTKHLMDDMKSGGIREYLHDIKSPSGMSQDATNVPYAIAAMAAQGYKDGPVTMEGVIEGKRQKIRTGSKAARAKVDDEIRHFVRGMKATAKSKETLKALSSILAEMDHLSPPPDEVKA